MSFVHEDPEFVALLAQISAETGIAAALVEKDYWITHSLWALRGRARARRPLRADAAHVLRARPPRATRDERRLP